VVCQDRSQNDKFEESLLSIEELKTKETPHSFRTWVWITKRPLPILIEAPDKF
jgi:hypothetical protein